VQAALSGRSLVIDSNIRLCLMLNLAGLSARMNYIVIALHKKGYQLSGYDDEIFNHRKVV
jgi:hypothetical protein